MQGLNKYKLVIITVILGLVSNIILDMPLMVVAYKLEFNPSYGAILGSIIGFSISVFMAMYVLNKKYNFSFRDTVKRLPNYFISYILFVVVIIAMKLIIPTELKNRFIQIPILILFAIVSLGVYIYINYKNGNLENVFGDRIGKFSQKIKRHK